MVDNNRCELNNGGIAIIKTLDSESSIDITNMSGGDKTEYTISYYATSTLKIKYQTILYIPDFSEELRTLINGIEVSDTLSSHGPLLQRVQNLISQ